MCTEKGGNVRKSEAIVSLKGSMLEARKVLLVSNEKRFQYCFIRIFSRGEMPWKLNGMLKVMLSTLCTFFEWKDYQYAVVVFSLICAFVDSTTGAMDFSELTKTKQLVL